MSLNELHHFWFGNIEVSEAYYARNIRLWFFRESPDFDRACERFAQLLDRHLIARHPKEILGQILLWDQIPRNIYRADARAYQYDKLAQDLVLRLLDTSFEQSLSLPERIFLYMPLEHAENLALQDISVQKFQELHVEAPLEIKAWTELGLKKAIDHRGTIEQYGRFPGRSITIANLLS